MAVVLIIIVLIVVALQEPLQVQLAAGCIASQWDLRDRQKRRYKECAHWFSTSI